MKNSTNANSSDEPAKPAPSKTTKKSTKGRAKSAKSENSNSKNGPASGGGVTSGGATAAAAVSTNSNPSNTTNSVVATATVFPSTPKPTMTTGSSAYDSPANSGSTNNAADSSGSSKSHHKSYAGFDARTVKIIWEQHDQSDVEISADVCTRLAEDASYKLWELINNVKTYARHSGGVVTYDLVNEVLRDSDVSPSLGAMDSDWDRIDYDGSFFFFSDKIIELRDEYQKDITITIPSGPDFSCAWPIEEKNADLLKKYIPSIIYVSLYGDEDALDVIHNEAAFSPAMGSCYRIILAKMIQILALKQNDPISVRCWRLLRALAFNPYTRDVNCREVYFHLSEILICQLLAPYETIKVHTIKVEPPVQEVSVKMEVDDVKIEPEQEVKNEFTDEEMFNMQTETKEEIIYKLQPDDDDDDNETKLNQDSQMVSPYFASPVEWEYVDELCRTIGQMAAVNGFFQSECIFNVVRRLERFFDGRNVSTERDYKYISRAVRVLFSLGEYAFREFIPFVYKFNPEMVPQNQWNDFAAAAVFLNGPDDIFLYEWLEFLCGADKLQPFMVHYAQYHDRLLTYRFKHRKQSTYKIVPKVGVRRLEWSTLAAAMCHGDDPAKALKPKPPINEYFPDLATPNLNLNRSGTIRFKFAGCRPVIIKPKLGQQKNKQESTSKPETSAATSVHKDIIIARRKLLKPLTNERRIVPLSSYYFVRI